MTQTDFNQLVETVWSEIQPLIPVERASQTKVATAKMIHKMYILNKKALLRGMDASVAIQAGIEAGKELNKAFAIQLPLSFFVNLTNFAKQEIALEAAATTETI